MLDLYYAHYIYHAHKAESPIGWRDMATLPKFKYLNSRRAMPAAQIAPRNLWFNIVTGHPVT